MASLRRKDNVSSSPLPIQVIPAANQKIPENQTTCSRPYSSPPAPLNKDAIFMPYRQKRPAYNEHASQQLSVAAHNTHSMRVMPRALTRTMEPSSGFVVCRSRSSAQREWMTHTRCRTSEYEGW